MAKIAVEVLSGFRSGLGDVEVDRTNHPAVRIAVQVEVNDAIVEGAKLARQGAR